MTKPQSTVLITGASSGIGKATAQLLLLHGWKVIAAARRTDEMTDLCASGAEIFPLDITNIQSRQSLVAHVHVSHVPRPATPARSTVAVPAAAAIVCAAGTGRAVGQGECPRHHHERADGVSPHATARERRHQTACRKIHTRSRICSDGILVHKPRLQEEEDDLWHVMLKERQGATLTGRATGREATRCADISAWSYVRALDSGSRDMCCLESVCLVQRESYCVEMSISFEEWAVAPPMTAH